MSPETFSGSFEALRRVSETFEDPPETKVVHRIGTTEEYIDVLLPADVHEYLLDASTRPFEAGEMCREDFLARQRADRFFYGGCPRVSLQ